MQILCTAAWKLGPNFAKDNIMYAKLVTLVVLSAMSASCVMQKPANYDAALSLCISEAAQAVLFCT